ncbi:M48 family metallopeptidase [Massilia pseudoviolaceinigra]|uniref:M48 family metallopeptidase n=1 Tax=Massilia pseudoviolaceinigra TaxID=3057165 RepID=UPI0027967ADC|nr:M48 family metallopeptidase [Massilia sp. CCM 9206]MDQ1923588.1 M48 family metallopeptidase [Massilia sp. CCM 9206]
MKYQPSLPEHNDNVSYEHPLKDFIVIAGWLLAATLLIFWLLGLAVDAMVDRLSHESEARLYALLPAKAMETAPAERAQQVQLQALVDSMRSCAGLRLPATITLTKSDTPNAAVVPGGNIIVFSGLLGQVRSENGLAFVLAHELAHITQRDHLRAMGRAIVLFGLSTLLTGSDSGLSDLLAPVNHLGQAKYSRNREAAADGAALRILNCRYGHAGGATELFAALKEEDEAFAGLSHYAASHPAMQDRIDTLNAAIKANGMKLGPVLPLRLAR